MEPRLNFLFVQLFQDQTAWCEAHQQYCVVNKPREKLGALVINNAGNCCQGWSSEGKRARKAHKSQYPLAVWLCQRKQLALDGQEDLFFQECTRHFDVESCLAGPLSSSHQVISLVVGPSELGWPTSRDRVLSAGISLRTLVWVGPTDPQKVEREFNYFFQRSCLLSGDVSSKRTRLWCRSGLTRSFWKNHTLGPS